MRKKSHKKKVLEHEILNILTLMGCYLSEKNLSPGIRKKMLMLLQSTSVLIKFQSLLLDEKPTFFLQKVPLKELITGSLIKSEISTEGISVPSSEYTLYLDRFYIGEALSELFKKIGGRQKIKKIEYDEENSIMEIFHTGKKILPQKKDPFLLLSSQPHKPDEIMYHISRKIFELHQITVQEKKGAIILSFGGNAGN